MIKAILPKETQRLPCGSIRAKIPDNAGGKAEERPVTKGNAEIDSLNDITRMTADRIHFNV